MAFKIDLWDRFAYMPSEMSVGFRGFDICILKAVLRIRNPNGFLRKIDDLFDLDTKNDVITFQRSVEGLVSESREGIVDKSTHQALLKGFKKLLVIDHSDSVELIPQRDDFTCWVASTSMMTKAKWEDIINYTPNEGNARLRWSDNGLYLNTLGGSYDSAELYAKIHKLHLHMDWDWSVSNLCTQLKRGPLLFINSFDSILKSGQPNSHAVVISGMISNCDPSGFGTFLQIHDPFPANVGSIHWWDYDLYVKKKPSPQGYFFSRKEGISYPIVYTGRMYNNVNIMNNENNENDVIYVSDIKNCPPVNVLIKRQQTCQLRQPSK